MPSISIKKFCDSYQFSFLEIWRELFSEYKIKELNDIGDEVKPGQVIKIPSSYAKKTTLYIDKTNYLPIYHKMEDEKGIYEIYEFILDQNQ